MSSQNRRNYSRRNEGNPGCGCLLLILIGLGIASFFAIARQAEFPGAETLRTAGRETEELYQQARDAVSGEHEPPEPAAARAVPVSPAPTPFLSGTRKPTPTASPSSGSDRATGAVQQPRPTQHLKRVGVETPTLSSPPSPVVHPTYSPTTTRLASIRPDQRHYDYKAYMLDLINEERAKAGVPTVTLGENIAAQLHAESSLANCFSGHWGLDGLKPYMRYSLAGGYQVNGENGSGLDYCIKSSDRYRELRSIESEIKEMMEGWMSSPGHRRNILDEWHRKVNIGLAWDEYNLFGYQHFEGGSVQYSQLPEISNGRLSLSGQTIGNIRFSSKDDLGLQIYYDPPPHPLTRGQVSRTYCYDSGIQIAAFRYPLTGTSYWVEDRYVESYLPCPDPYDVTADSPAPRSHDEAHRFWQEAYRASQSMVRQTVTVPWITASTWTARGTDFSVTADISSLLDEHGPGVYTVLLWGEVGGESIPVSEYSVFHGIEPPDTYDPEQWQ